MAAYSCPYCGGELPSPTRKRICPNCKRVVFVRTRPNQQPNWVKEEDLPIIAKEWANETIRRDKELNLNTLNSCRQNIRQSVQNGTVKSLKFYTANDNQVCPYCRSLEGKSFPLRTSEDISQAMECSHIKNCQNPAGCRCYLRPE